MTDKILNFFKASPKDNDNNVLNFMDNDDLESNDQTSMIKSVKNNISKSIEVETNYTTFFIVFSVGIGFIIFSTLFLPIIILTPSSFVSLFSIGSIITISSFIFIYGTTQYFGMLFEGKRWIYTLIYLASIICGIYFSQINKNYLVCLLSALVQIVMLCVFVLSFIPGGESGISFIFQGIKGMISMFFKKIFSRGG